MYTSLLEMISDHGYLLQIQAELGEGHINIVDAKEVILTDTHLCLVMEYAAGNNLTGHQRTAAHRSYQTYNRSNGTLIADA
jgi:hypothetical protein